MVPEETGLPIQPSGWEMVRLMWMAQYAIFSAAAEELHAIGLNPKSMAVLGIVEVVPHPQEIANSLGSPLPTVSNILKDLEKLGYVSRELAPGDRRRTVVRRTEKGEDAHRRAVAAIDEKSGPIFAGLSAAEYRTLHGLLYGLSARHHLT